MIYGLLLLLLAHLAHYATPMLIDLNPMISTNASNGIKFQCFTPRDIPWIQKTNLTECRMALNALARTSDFTTPFTYSKNHRRGRGIPRGWLAGDCIIIVSCQNDRDAYTFRYADVLAIAKRLVDLCVASEGKIWGGVDVLGDSETFYVSVGKPHDPVPPGSEATSLPDLELVNATLLDQAIGVS